MYRAKISRRKLLGLVGAGAGGAVVTRALGASHAEAATTPSRNHLAWVWQFEDDGAPDLIRSTLARNGLGILLKTHDGTHWMSRFHDTLSINGGRDVQMMASYFEAAGVPFHAWCVVEGRDPITEAQMCAEVLGSGARSLVFDLESAKKGNYWQGDRQSALAFGRELRRLQPRAWLTVAPDPRPWQVNEVPIAEFASFSNDIAPQTYWNTFNTPANYRLLRDFGYEVGPEGMTPELILDVTRRALGGFRLPLWPVGQGSADVLAWQRFVRHAYQLGMDAISVWRYGTSDTRVWPLLRDMKPRQGAATTPPRTFSAPLAPPIPTPDVVRPSTSTTTTTTSGNTTAPTSPSTPKQPTSQTSSTAPQTVPSTSPMTTNPAPVERQLTPSTRQGNSLFGSKSRPAERWQAPVTGGN